MNAWAAAVVLYRLYALRAPGHVKPTVWDCCWFTWHGAVGHDLESAPLQPSSPKSAPSLAGYHCLAARALFIVGYKPGPQMVFLFGRFAPPIGGTYRVELRKDSFAQELHKALCGPRPSTSQVQSQKGRLQPCSRYTDRHC